MISLADLERELDALLCPQHFDDYCPNGLQVEGRATVGRLVTGVTASQALIDAAVAAKAHAVLVHHGFFWRGEEQPLRGMKRRRVATLLANDISLFAYHLPLDAHEELGNNAQLGKLLGIRTEAPLQRLGKRPLGLVGRLDQDMTAESFAASVGAALQREPLLVSGGGHRVRRVAWCTGGAQDFIAMAAAAGADAYLSGEISEQTVHFARENGIHYLAAGHHATERYGARAVGEYLAARHGIEQRFIDIDNPA